MEEKKRVPSGRLRHFTFSLIHQGTSSVRQNNSNSPFQFQESHWTFRCTRPGDNAQTGVENDETRNTRVEVRVSRGTSRSLHGKSGDGVPNRDWQRIRSWEKGSVGTPVRQLVEKFRNVFTVEESFGRGLEGWMEEDK